MGKSGCRMMVGLCMTAIRPVRDGARPLQIEMTPLSYTILEIGVRSEGEPSEPAGLVIRDRQGKTVSLLVDPAGPSLHVGGRMAGRVALPEAPPSAWRQLRVEKDGGLLRVSVDGRRVHTALIEIPLPV